ncbi:hypothetical protein ACFL1E_00945 [Candidatus Omnitrophota bacterium]
MRRLFIILLCLGLVAMFSAQEACAQEAEKTIVRRVIGIVQGTSITSGFGSSCPREYVVQNRLGELGTFENRVVSVRGKITGDLSCATPKKITLESDTRIDRIGEQRLIDSLQRSGKHPSVLQALLRLHGSD